MQSQISNSRSAKTAQYLNHKTDLQTTLDHLTHTISESESQQMQDLRKISSYLQEQKEHNKERQVQTQAQISHRRNVIEDRLALLA